MTELTPDDLGDLEQADVPIATGLRIAALLHRAAEIAERHWRAAASDAGWKREEIDYVLASTEVRD